MQNSCNTTYVEGRLDMTNDDDLAAARLLLRRMGISPSELIDFEQRVTCMSLRQLVSTVSAVVPVGSRRVFAPYWRKALKVWPDAQVGEISFADVVWFIQHAKETAVVRRTSRGGHYAAEHAYAAMRCLFRYAVGNRLLSPWEDPTAEVIKPKRLASNRRALQPELVEEIVEVASTTGNDPHLDALLMRTHIETAARRGGALALRLRDLDPDQCQVFLRQKGGSSHWQPVSRTLMTGFQEHAYVRGARDPDDGVLRYHNGRPLSARRYDNLWSRVGEYVPTVRSQGVTTHWLRHTTLTWVERAYGYGVAMAYAGHAAATGGLSHGVTAVYVKADIYDVATALAELTGEEHPLALVPPTWRADAVPESTPETEIASIGAGAPALVG
ncbi:tyrosine-type recombinase/integrase [Lentzea sp. NPDC102401]|uniref:tyrosine-type recombinase/integrase n=1 Tax=Lentzea sp. NPDC102401 TaxID=3364128 RepID=UPI0037FD72FD